MFFLDYVLEKPKCIADCGKMITVLVEAEVLSVEIVVEA